jgi:hypothetical protein
MIRIKADDPPEADARDVKQRCERRLKKIFLSTSQKYQWLLIVREQQIYGFAGHMSGQNRYFCQSLKTK